VDFPDFQVYWVEFICFTIKTPEFQAFAPTAHFNTWNQSRRQKIRRLHNLLYYNGLQTIFLLYSQSS